MTICIATGNAHKFGEFQCLFPDLPLCSLADLKTSIQIDENGSSYIENACIKAKAAFDATHMPCLGDDSGFEVAALNWGPGIYSARYAQGSDADRRNKLWNAVQEAWQSQGTNDRRVRFQCALALAAYPDLLNQIVRSPLPDGFVFQNDCLVALGCLEGQICAPRGSGGFGYDPLCELPDRGLTVAELPEGEKHAISHRGRAAARIRPFLKQLLALSR